MASGQDLINCARGFVGEPYSTGPGRADPNSGYKDCSGLIAASYLVATGRPLGADVSVTIYDLCVSQGLWIPKDFAVNIAGACLLMPEDPYQGWGSAGHIGFADGFGGTVEATPPRVQNLPVTYQPWGSNACMLPGIDYTNYGQGGGEEDNMKCAIIKKQGEPFLYVWDGGFKYPTVNAQTGNLLHFLGRSENASDSAWELSPHDFDSIPNLKDITD